MLLHSLEAFAAVYELKNFTRAAERLCLSQSAVSQSIRKMEEELGVRLFEREKKGIRPTPEAEELYGHVRLILEEWAEAMSDLTGKGMEVKLYYYLRATQKEKNFLIAELLRALPELSIRQVPSELDALMHNETWEEGFPYLVPAEFVTSEEIRRFLLSEAGHCLIMSENSDLAKKDRIALQDLKGQSLVLPGRFRFGHIQETLKKLEEAKISYEVASFALASEVIPKILAFGGVAIMPEYIVNSQPGIVTRPLDDGVRIPIYLAWRGKPSAGLRRILRYLRAR